MSVSQQATVALPGRHPIGFQAFGGPTASSWREQALTRVAELEDLAEAFSRDYPVASPERDVLAEGLRRHLHAARQAAEGPAGPGLWRRLKSAVGGSPLERAASNLDAAEIDLLRIAPQDYLQGQLPSLLAGARAHLPVDDPRRQTIEHICAEPAKELARFEKDAVIAAGRATKSAARREIVQVRSFRNILYVTAAALVIVVTGLILVARSEPQLVPLCFNPRATIVCPTDVAPVAENASQTEIDRLIRDSAGSWDVALVALVGLVAAAMAAAVSLRNLRGTTLPYSLPVALAVLKLPTGALTAVLGLLLMRGDFVPGLSALDSPGQIVAWAILFGYAQQLFTRLVDDRAHSILNDVGGQAPARGPSEVKRVVVPAKDSDDSAPE